MCVPDVATKGERQPEERTDTMSHARVRNMWWMQHHVHRVREVTACSET